MEKGRRPRRQFNVISNRFTETNFASYYGLKSQFDLSTISVSRTRSSCAGAAAYNQRTKTLVIVHQDSSTTADATVYRGTKDLFDDCILVEDFFNNCTVTEFISGINLFTGGNSENYNLNMVMGDNDHLAIQMRNGGNDTKLRVYDLSATTHQSTSKQVGSDSNNNGTTSYGAAQGLMYRGRMQMTWDGDWCCLYSPYYYYGNGMLAYIFSRKDPRINFAWRSTNSNYGSQLFPSGRSGFAWFRGQNTDSQPIESATVQLDAASHDYAETNYIIPTNNYNANSNNVTYTKGQVISWNSSTTNHSCQVPGHSYTTSYPQFQTVDNWEKVPGEIY